MAKQYTYPHTNITTKALQRRVPAVSTSTATTLLAPFICDRGPENILVPIDSYADFVATFGNLDYRKDTQRQILNIQNWLSAGGRVLACRITDIDSEDTPTAQIAKQTKYYLTAYDGNKNTYTVEVEESKLTDIYYYDENDDNTAHLNTIDIENKKLKLIHYTSNLSADTIFKLESSNKDNIFIYKIDFEAKYSGDYYNNLKVEIEPASNNTTYFNVTISYIDPISENDTRLEFYRNKTFNDIITSIPNISSYIGKIEISKYIQKSQSGAILTVIGDNNLEVIKTPFIKENPKFKPFADGFVFNEITGGVSLNDEFISGDDGEELVDALSFILKQPLETPVDCFIDCGYSVEVKTNLLKLFVTGEGVIKKRDDIFVYFTDCEITGTGETFNKTNITEKEYSDLGAFYGSGYNNILMIRQYDKIQYYPFDDSATQVFVPLTYYYAQKVPYYDEVNGPQYPIAGTSKGKINVNSINYIPSDDEKQEYYDNQLNYAERDSRGTYIMTNLTCDTDNTELKFASKSRALLKMKKELALIGREYLHEFNDNITRTNLQNRLNTYIASWIQNKTLSKGYVELYDYTDDDTLTNEEILIKLSVVFNRTIEIISVEITVA